ncbi:MAG TPA: dipeptidase [Bacteroidales bacterium]|nr:membrane dipeptidase [Bacteroidales bacterium]HNR42176.1 dipeptidase [Bacteroidales bacterium]HQG77973.1 dipeptidase [Bacteroidales bacterium]
MRKLAGLLFIILVCSSCGTTEERLSSKAVRIHRKILSIDTHCDTPMEMMRTGYDLGLRNEKGCVDFPRMREGSLDGEFFAVFIPQGHRNDSMSNVVHLNALEIFKRIHENVEKNSDMAGLAVTADDAFRLKKKGRLSAFIGLENGYPIGNDISRISQYYDLGARYITLCHTRNNDICDSSTDPAGPEHNGLSDLGKQVVREMNRQGMMVDVSHISDKAFYDVLQISTAPVIASHSCCRALCESPRNLTDDMLLALKANGGVVQICLLSGYVKTPAPNPEFEEKLKELRNTFGEYEKLSDEKKELMFNEYVKIKEKYEKLATVRDVVDHIDHVVQVAGIDFVGIGTDFDGGGSVEGCKSAAEMRNITIELLRRGYSKADISKIWGGNIMRVLRAASLGRKI